jgi:hypothetical protein
LASPDVRPVIVIFAPLPLTPGAGYVNVVVFVPHLPGDHPCGRVEFAGSTVSNVEFGSKFVAARAFSGVYKKMQRMPKPIKAAGYIFFMAIK